MKSFWTRSLTGQLIFVMLVAVALSQLVSLILYQGEQMRAVRVVLRDECMGRAASSFRLIEATPPAARAQLLETIGTPLTRYWISAKEPDAVTDWLSIAREHLLRPTAATRGGSPSPSLFLHETMLEETSDSTWETLPSNAWLLGRPVHLLAIPEWNGFGIAIPLSDGSWINTIYAKPSYLMRSTFTLGYYITLGITVLIFAVAAFFMARRISRPLRHLTESAERLGRGEDVDLLPEEGPDDIRSTVTAFNRMQIRLRRFVEDRTRMLAAIGHDLRTPITSLRLRAEFVKDDETREKLIATLEEMRVMTEATLAFSREEATVEPTRTIDLDALLESLCADLADLGWDITFSDGERIPWRCRPDALRRAARNLIENAVRYGHRARVQVRQTDEGAEILVEDDGPGLLEADHERVFAPFVRMETSRNRETGGVGLGLSIARTIVRSHGGDILLSNRPGGGLRATIRLPR